MKPAPLAMNPLDGEPPAGAERPADGAAHGAASGAAKGRASVVPWADRWHAWRDRTLASSAFQRWAAAFPLTRRTARRRAQALFDLVAGFVYSQVLYACVRLQLFDTLARGPQTLAALAPQLGLTEEAAQRLLTAAVALKLAEQRSGSRFGLGPLGAPMVGNAAIAAMVEHHAALYVDLRDPVALLKGDARAAGALAGYWPYAAADAPGALAGANVATYSALMSASQPLVADLILDAYPLARHQTLLDVGGGEGTFLCRAAERTPALKVVLFDLPAVAQRARICFAEKGFTERSSAVGGDFLIDELPRGADIASLVRVVHDHDDARVMHLLRAVHRALPARGKLLLAEPMADTPGAEAMGNAYFGFYLLAMGRGRPRSAAELTSMLLAAGFKSVRIIPTHMPLQTSLLLASAG
jgi:demethylspheroidene O-methyltransferase